LRSLGIRGLFPLTDEGKRQIATSNLLPAVIYATRVTLVLVFVGLVLVFLSIAVPNWLSAICEYCATYAFIIALAVVRAGIFNPDERWLSRSLMDAGKWIVTLTALATVGGLIGLYAHDVVDVLRKAVETAFSAISVLGIGYVLYLYGTKPEKKQKPRRRRKRK
jgi:threonine/homoserine/homoserine lactone efflux protein